jgi:hypothetical protein
MEALPHLRELCSAPDDLQIGDDSLSIAELAEEVRRVERELAALELELR